MAGGPWDDYAGAATAAPSADTKPWEDFAARPLTIHGTSPLAMLPPPPPTPPADDGTLPNDTKIGNFDVSKANALTARTALEAGVKGVLGVPALLDDAGINAAYYGKKLLSKTGMVDAPDPANYGLDQTSFPATTAAGKIAEMAPDALGLRKPVTAADRMTSAIGEGALGAAAGVGAGNALGLIPGMARAGNFLAAEPVAQVASGALSGGTGEGAQQAGVKPGGASVAATAAGILPFLLSRGHAVRADARATNTLRPAGQENAAAGILQENATNPAAASRAAATAPTLVPGSRPSGIEAANDAGLNRIDQHLEGLEANGVSADRGRTNNQARIDFLRQAGIGDTSAEDAAYAKASATAEAEKPAVFAGRPDMDAGPILQRFRTMARDRNATSDVQEMARSAYNEIRSRTDPVMGTDAQGKPVEIGRTINPAHLEAAKTSFAAPYTSKGSTLTTPAYVQNTRRVVFENGGALDTFNRHIESGAPGYQAYLDRQAKMRDAADRMNFGNTLLEKSTDNYTANGVPQISPTKFGNLTRPGKMDDVLAPGNRMTLDRLSTGPNSGPGFAIDAVRADLERQQQPALRGTGVRGSNTQPRQAFAAGIDEAARRGLPLTNRALTALAPAVRVLGPLGAVLTAGPAGHGLVAAGSSIAAGQAAGLLSAGARGSAGRAAQGVRDALGQARSDPAVMSRLLARPVVQRPGARAYAMVPGSGVANLARPGGIVGALMPRSDPPRKKKKGR